MTLLEEYLSTLKKIETEDILDLTVYRPLGFLLVKRIKHTNITPNHITLMAVTLGMLSGILMSFGTKLSFFFAGIFFFLYHTLDCADGQLARIKKNGTPFGRIIDGAADYIANIFAYVGIGIGWCNQTSSPVFWWSLLVLAGISNVIQSVLVDNYRSNFLNYNDKNKESDIDILRKGERSKQKLSIKIVLNIYDFYENIQKYFSSQIEKKSEAEVKKLAHHPKYREYNRISLRLWTSIGPTFQATLMAITCIIFRPDLYIIVIIVGFNAWALMCGIIQKRQDSLLEALKTNPEF